MTEYIKREDAENAINRLRIGLRGQGLYEADLIAAEAKHRIQSVPAADVAEVRHGEWICSRNKNGWVLYKCPFCGNEGWRHDPYIPKYCHECGAKMDGGADDAAD